jgi:alpha-mannosidase
LARAQPLAAHLYAERGPVRQAAATLLKTELGPVLLTRLEAEGTGVALTLLNPSDAAVEVTVGGGALKPARASRTSLAGVALEAVPVTSGQVRLSVGPRAWTRLAVYPE